MMKIRRLRGEEGYTLLETVVALALFVSVLLPLGAAIGNFMLDKTADQLRLALRAAETEMSRVTSDNDFIDGTITDARGLILGRTAHRRENLVDIRITVSSVKKPEKTLLVLNKTVLTHQ